MTTDERTNQLLECLLQVIARASIPLEIVQAVVGTKKKQIKAFNLCDGRNNQREIAKKAGLDPGNLSRTVNRWLQNGVVFSVGENNDTKPLHIYPIPEGSRTPKRRRQR